MSRDFPVKGLKELDMYLSALPMNMQKGAVQAGLRAAGNVIKDEAQLRAPKKTGKMAKSIGLSSPKQNSNGTFSVQVRMRGPKEKGGNDHVYLGLLHEYGVAPHLIARTGKGEGRVAVRKAADGDGKVTNGVMKIGDKFVSGILRHPGHAAHPFMRPALDVKADEAVRAFAVRIADYIEGKTGFAAPLDEAA